MPQAKYVQLDDKHRPSLNMEDSETGDRVQMWFGYKDGDPTVAIFKGDELDPILVLPKEILDIAVDQGWADCGNECPHCNPEQLGLPMDSVATKDYH